jgi:hypothetical protein
VGVAGTIYSQVRHDLEQKMGVIGTALNTLPGNLRYYAITPLAQIIRLRRIKMGTHTGHATSPPSKTAAATDPQHRPNGRSKGNRPASFNCCRPMKHRKR